MFSFFINFFCVFSCLFVAKFLYFHFDFRIENVTFAPHSGFYHPRFSTRAVLSRRIFYQDNLDFGNRYDVLFHLAHFRRISAGALRTMAKSFDGVADGNGNAQLFSRRIFRARQRDSAGTNAGNFGKRSANADQCSDRRRFKFGLVVCRSDF